ncbi:MAG: rhomboid family intramembrane serine protease [Candidatus Limnocylindrales bacterium]
MDDAPPPAAPRGPDPSRTGRLTRDAALALLTDANAALSAGEFREAAMRYGRVVGFDDPEVTVAALVGLGEARYRLDDDEAALQSWEAATQLGETQATYAAWRNVAAARVRSRDLKGAIDAYRQADRRAPAQDKAEIATRLGWLTKETGDQRASSRYFAKGRGAGPLVSASMAILAATVIVSLSATLSEEGRFLYDVFQLDKQAVAAGEIWRLWTVTLLHGSLLHLFFNMYALYLAGPVVERWYGSVRFVLFYLACAAAGSVASFVFGGDVPSVGASGAIFGLFGLLLVAGRLHKPVDRQSRALVSQLGMLILINIAFGFALPGIDNAAHLGGLAAGALIGALVPPHLVQTLTSLWQRPGEAGTAHVARVPILALLLALGAVAVVVVIGLVIGTDARTA